MKNYYLEPLIKEIDNVTSEVNSEFGSLNTEQLNWKPQSEAWSIGQCLEHIIISNSRYFPMMEDLTAGDKKNSFWERLPLFPKMFGKMLIKSTQNESKKVKTFKVFMPSGSSINPDIIRQFTNHQEELKKLMLKTNPLNPTTIITSPVSKYITYSLQDALTILVYHERRHLNQAKRVMKTERFPSNN
jgi:uncharacterized damage-inducible protein DinB